MTYFSSKINQKNFQHGHWLDAGSIFGLYVCWILIHMDKNMDESVDDDAHGWTPLSLCLSLSTVSKENCRGIDSYVEFLRLEPAIASQVRRISSKNSRNRVTLVGSRGFSLHLKNSVKNVCWKILFVSAKNVCEWGTFLCVCVRRNSRRLYYLSKGHIEEESNHDISFPHLWIPFYGGVEWMHMWESLGPGWNWTSEIKFLLEEGRIWKQWRMHVFQLVGWVQISIKGESTCCLHPPTQNLWSTSVFVSFLTCNCWFHFNVLLQATSQASAQMWIPTMGKHLLEFTV